MEDEKNPSSSHIVTGLRGPLLDILGREGLDLTRRVNDAGTRRASANVDANVVVCGRCHNDVSSLVLELPGCLDLRLVGVCKERQLFILVFLFKR